MVETNDDDSFSTYLIIWLKKVETKSLINSVLFLPTICHERFYFSNFKSRDGLLLFWSAVLCDPNKQVTYLARKRYPCSITWGSFNNHYLSVFEISILKVLLNSNPRYFWLLIQSILEMSQMLLRCQEILRDVTRQFLIWRTGSCSCFKNNKRITFRAQGRLPEISARAYLFYLNGLGLVKSFVSIHSMKF